MKERIANLLLLVFFFLIPTVTHAATPAWVTVHDTGLIWGQDILLGSIADISCADSQRLQNLINMRLGIIAKPGDVKTLTAYVLQLKIKSSGVDSSNITWSIPNNIAITRASQTVAATQVVKTATDAMQQEVQKSGEQRKWTIEALTTGTDMIIPPGDVTMQAEIPYGVKYNVPTVVYVNFKVKGVSAGRALCRLQLHVFDDVVVAAKAVRANVPLTADDLHIEKKETGAQSPYYLTDIADAVGKLSRYPLKPGDILKNNSLVSPILIKRGMPVHIIAKQNNLMVKTDGIAMENGSKDEFIKVKNSTTNVIITAQVVDTDTVIIQNS